MRRVVEKDYQWVEILTWVFNRKGIPLYKRGGFRAVSGTSLLMENYLPMIIRHLALRPYFEQHDYVKTLVSQRSYGYDHLRYHDLSVFQYQWRAGAEVWEVLVDFQRRQLASIACREWSFGAWVVQDQPLRVRMRLENRAKDEVVCEPSDGSGVVLGALRGETRQMDWDASALSSGGEGRADFLVRVGRLRFPFTVQRSNETLAQSVEKMEDVHA